MAIDKLPVKTLKTKDDIKSALNSLDSSFANSNIDASIFTGLNRQDFADLVTKNSNDPNNTNSIFYKNINAVGAENVFDALDTNGKEGLQADELEKYTKLDGDAKAFSMQEAQLMLLEILNKALAAITGEENPKVADALNSMLPIGQKYYDIPSTNGYTPEAKQPTTKEKAATLEKDQIPELEAKKKTIIETADKNIQEQEKLMNDTIQQNSKISKELKAQCDTLNASLTSVTSQIQGVECELAACDSSNFSLDSAISALEGEQSTLNTSTKDEKINTQNSARKNEISSQLKSKKGEKTKLEDKKKELQTKKQGLEKQKAEIEHNLDAATKQCEAADPGIQNKLVGIKSKINALKIAKEKDVASIDSAIQTKRTEAIQYQKESGEQVGKASEGLGSDIIQNALKYEGMNESDGSYKKFTNGRTEAWCADFVSYVVKETYEKNGKELPKGFGTASVCNLQQWGKDNNCYSEKSQTANLKAGDIVIFRNNGASHTGLVASVDKDGTVHTIEGNTSDKVAKRDYPPSKQGTISGYIQLDKYND